ncbi:hypothetical protein FD755_001990, partial [Muntiacus reevesi]
RCRLGSTSSNSSCASAEYPGEAIPHHPGKFTLPFMAMVLESPEHSDSAQASTSTITYDLAQESMGKQQPGKTNCRSPS